MRAKGMMGVLLVSSLGWACDSSAPAPDSQVTPPDSSSPGQEARPAADAGAPGSEASVGKEAGAQTATVGAACTAATSCEKGGSGIPKCRIAWPEGYCLIEGCASADHDCPGDPGMGQSTIGAAKCVLAPTPTCLLVCGSETDCRQGYQCTGKSDAMGHGSVKVCMPK